MKRLLISIFVLNCCAAEVTRAQARHEKQVYVMILDSLYHKTAVRYTNTLSDTVKGLPDSAIVLQMTEPHYIYLDRFPVASGELTQKSTYVDYFYTRQKGLRTSELSDLSACSLNNKPYCYEVIANQDPVNYREQKRCGTAALSVRRYTFSTILYSKDRQNGLLTVRQQQENTSVIWLVLLRRQKTAWTIARMTGIAE